MNSPDVWYLENVDAEGIFCPKKLGHTNPSHFHVNFEKGDAIFSPNESSDKIYYITSGRVKIGAESDGERAVTKAILGPGEIFGELALVGEEKRRHKAVALESTSLCVIRRDQLTTLFKDHNPLYLFMLRLIGSRAIRMEKRLESLVFKDSRTRIIDFLIALKKEKGERVGYEWVVRRFMTHQQIASLTATSRQTVTTVLNDLKSRGLLTFDRRRLLIRDFDALEKEVEGSFT